MRNTVKQKLAEGKQVVGGTIQTPDPDIYRSMANAGFDFLWIEMQHSPLTYQDVARMIWAGRDAPALPFIRVPDATEGDGQTATDIGALGVIVPMVNSVSKVEDAVRYASYPPRGARSLGAGQCHALYGGDYRQTANDDILVCGMVESPQGVEIAAEMAAVDAVDVVFVAATDLGSFSGLKQGDEEYEAMAAKVRDETLGAGKHVGGPFAWKDREGYSFFQAPPAEYLVSRAARALLAEIQTGVAQTEGTEK
ncbi:MAG: aldolase/citrate lyase family protein [Acidobacteriota bacterium]|nr:aldolase/citrate lyase family protein [Acidobacteriota bacterium]